VDRIIGGWQLNASYQMQSARPIGFGNIIYTGNFDDITLDPDMRSPDKWINIDAGFNRVSAQQLDKNIRTFPLRLSSVRSDIVNNWDISIIKNTQITEGKTIQFRCEALNAFNNPNFAAPDASPTSANFGKVTSTFNYSRRIQLSLKFLM